MRAAVLVVAFSAVSASTLRAHPYGHDFTEVAECNAEYTIAAKKLCDLGVKEYCPPKPVEEIVERISRKEEGAPAHVDAESEYRPPQGEQGRWDHLKHGDDWGCPAQNQSPVDIQKDVDLQGQSKFVLWFDFKAPEVQESTTGRLVNDGHSLYFSAADSKVDMGDIKLGGAEHSVRRYDLHSPSEHTIDGQVFPLELEILTESERGEKVMVSVLFKESKTSNKFLKGLMTAAPKMPVWTVEKGEAGATLTGKTRTVFDLEAAVPMSEIHPGSDMTFYNYEGSMTFPPCEGSIDWWVIQEPLSATKEEIEHVKKAILGSASMADGNNRRVQDLHNRPVMIGHTGLQHHTGGHKMPKKTQERLRGYTSQDMPWGGHWDK